MFEIIKFLKTLVTEKFRACRLLERKSMILMELLSVVNMAWHINFTVILVKRNIQREFFRDLAKP